MATTKYLDYAGLQRYHGKLKTDVITPINNRIDEIVNVGGQPNVIEAVKINNNTFAIADKTASLAMNLTYDGTAKKIKLAIGSETQEIDATDFIKDGMLDSATYSADTKKLTLTFNTAAGKDAIDVDLTDLVDTYALSAGDATTGSYLTLTPGVSGTGSTSDPWKVTVALDETNLTTELTNIKENAITTLSNTSQAGNVTPFAIYYGKSLGSNIMAGGSIQISGLKAEGLTKADTATYETLTLANTGSTFENVMQKFLANDIDLNTRLTTLAGTVGGLGSAATKDESYFAKAKHTHSTMDVATKEALNVNPEQTTVETSVVGGALIDKPFVQLLTNDSLLDGRLTTVEGTVGGLGSAATKDESYFAKAVHTHKTSEVTNDVEILWPDDHAEMVKSLDAGMTLNSDLSRLLGNDNLLNTRLASVEDQQVATIDMTAITGMTAAGEYETDALTSENLTTLQGALDKAITHGTTIVLSYSLGGEFILCNIHRSGNMYVGSFYNSNSVFTDYSFTCSDEGMLMIKSAVIASISNTEIDALFA